MDINKEAFQIGGDHYSSEYPHWDLCVRVSLSYLGGCATKYVIRWRKKGGIQDLKKSLTYLNKQIETASHDIPRRLSLPAVDIEVAAFCRANDLGDLERAYISALCRWTVKEDLEAAREFLFLLMDEAEALADAKSVPLTEENMHAAHQED